MRPPRDGQRAGRGGMAATVRDDDLAQIETAMHADWPYLWVLQELQAYRDDDKACRVEFESIACSDQLMELAASVIAETRFLPHGSVALRQAKSVENDYE